MIVIQNCQMHYWIIQILGDGDQVHGIQSMDPISIVVGWGTGVHLEITTTALDAQTEDQGAVADVTVSK